MSWSMGPLTRAGSIDWDVFQWCHAHGQDALFDALSATRAEHMKQAKMSYMSAGNCDTPPLPYRAELLKAGEAAQRQHQNLQDLSAPPTLIESAEWRVRECLAKLTTLAYAEAHEGGVDYRARYETWEQAWYRSHAHRRASAMAFFAFVEGARQAGFAVRDNGQPIPATLTETEALLDADFAHLRQQASMQSPTV